MFMGFILRRCMNTPDLRAFLHTLDQYLFAGAPEEGGTA